MKNTITLLLLFISINIGFSQCEIPGGDMETFSDLTEDFEADLNIMLDEPVVISEGFQPAIRFFLFIFSDLLGDLIGAELTEFVQDGLGQAAYTPGANGTATGLQLLPGATFNIADGGTEQFACGDRPYGLSGYYRHVGLATDTAYILAILDETANYDPIFSDMPIETADIDAYAFEILPGGPDEYIYFEAPITYNNNEVPDSAIIYIATQGDSTSIAQGNESYYVFDELKFIAEPSNVKELDHSNTVLVYPNPATDLVTVQSDEFEMNNIKVYDAFGKLVMVRNSVNLYSMNLDVSNLVPGIYFIETEIEDYFARKKFVKE